MDADIRDVIAENQDPDLSNTASGKVIEYIKNKIIYREWKTGDKLPTEPELCKLVNVSRTAVREAVKILEANNVVRIRRGDGTYISDAEGSSSVNFLLFKVLLQNVSNNELDSFRDAMELEIMRFVISCATEHDIALLKASYNDMARCIRETPEDHAALNRYDIEFHCLLADICDNTLLREIYRAVMEIYSPLILRNYRSGQAGITGLRVHALIIDAVENRDYIGAGYAVRSSTGLCSNWVRRSQGDPAHQEFDDEKYLTMYS